MISLILTLFISLLSLVSPIYRLEENSVSRISTISNESFIFDDSKSINYAFAEENGEGDGYVYCYTQSDLCNLYSFQSLYNYVSSYVGNINQATDYYAPIKKLTLGTWNTFDYAAGYDWVIRDVYEANIINLYWVRYDDYDYYAIYFLNNTSSNPGRYYGFRFHISIDFDYMVSVEPFWSSVSDITGNTNMVALYGDTAVSNQYSSLYDILGFDRGGAGYESGYSNGYNNGIRVGDSQGYQRGYQEGLTDGLINADYDSTAVTIFTGITSIALVPINMFLQIFNFEILGINLSGFISGLLTVAVVVIIIRMITGGKKDD